jgi:hypothetical protein
MSRRKPFIDRALDGEVRELREIEEDVRSWHECPTTTCGLHEWLGMTHEEYRLWVERSSVLPYILQARKYSIPIAQHLASLESAQTAPRVAAPNGGRREVEELVGWLKRTGRLPKASRKKRRTKVP